MDIVSFIVVSNFVDFALHGVRRSVGLRVLRMCMLVLTLLLVFLTVKRVCPPVGFWVLLAET